MPMMFKNGGVTGSVAGGGGAGVSALTEKEQISITEQQEAEVQALQSTIEANKQRLQANKQSFSIADALSTGLPGTGYLGAIVSGFKSLVEAGLPDLSGLSPAEKRDAIKGVVDSTTEGTTLQGSDFAFAGNLSLADSYGFDAVEKGGKQFDFLSTLPPLPLNATPLAAPAPVALGGLPGSAPLASLDPFLSAPDPNVLQPTIFAHGGAVMSELGFRPLGYAEGDLVDEAWNDFEAVTKSDLTKVEMARYLYDNLERLKKAAADNTARTRMLDQVMRWSGFDEYRESIMPQSGEESPLPAPLPDSTGTLFEAIAGQPGGVRPGDTGPSVGGPYSKYMNNIAPMEGRGMAPTAPMEDFPRYGGPPREMREDRLPEYGSHVPQDIAHGGYVGRRPGHYAHGGYTSRGTVAGELPRYGRMSVREEGETMGELSKRHRDQDWYRRMRGGLGSLGPRRRVA